MFYQIKDTLTKCTKEECLKFEKPFVALVTTSEWEETKDTFDMVIDIDFNFSLHQITKAEVNYDSLTGAFSIPDKNDLLGPSNEFYFALDEKGIVFIDDSEYVKNILSNIMTTKKWRIPSLERFLYDFLERIITGDMSMLEQFEKRLDDMETDILDKSSTKGDFFEINSEITTIRSSLLDLHTYYEQLFDLGNEFYENENEFFKDDNLRYFDLFKDRVSRLQDRVSNLRDYALQIIDLQKTQLDIKQNNIMTILTVITSIFMPLTLIAGWYGMNFKYMPELDYKYSYLIIIVISIIIAILMLIYFKKKKWL